MAAGHDCVFILTVDKGSLQEGAVIGSQGARSQCRYRTATGRSGTQDLRNSAKSRCQRVKQRALKLNDRGGTEIPHPGSGEESASNRRRTGENAYSTLKKVRRRSRSASGAPELRSRGGA